MSESPEINDSPDPPNPEPPRAGLLQRLRARLPGLPRLPDLSRFTRFLPSWRVLIGVGAAATAVVGIGVAMWARPGVDRNQVKARVKKALDALDADRIAEARVLASELRKDAAFSVTDLGGPVYVLGASLCSDAETQDSLMEKRRQYLLASRYLQEARDRGFPEGRERDGVYLLATSTYHANRFAESIPLLHEAVKAKPEFATVLQRMLATAYLGDTPPQLDNALKHNSLHLEDQLLSPDERAEGLLQQCQILFQQGRFDVCRERLAKIEEGEWASDALVLEGRIHLQEADRLRKAGGEQQLKEAAAKYELAATRFQHPRVRIRRSRDSTRVAHYLIGRCFRHLDQLKAAETQFAQTRGKFYGSHEGLAAALEEAEVQRQLGQDNQAVTSYQRVLEEAGDPASYNNPWIPLQEFRSRISNAYLQYFDSGKFDLALKLALALSPLFPEAQSVALQAETHREWARTLDAQTKKLSLKDAQPVKREAEGRYRKAGQVYAALAEMRYATSAYPGDLWDSGEAYLHGKDFRASVRMLNRYFLTNNQKILPQALVAKGTALLALNQLDEAREPLEECIQRFKASPDGYQARLILSRVLVEQGDLEGAKAQLLRNLESDLTPKSLPWRKSLLAMGRVAYLAGSQHASKSRIKGLGSVVVARDGTPPSKEPLRELEKAHRAFGDAIRWLDEAIARWPDDPQIVLTRYRSAKSHQQRAKLPKHLLPLEKIETSREELRRRMYEELEEARRKFESLGNDLTSRQVTTELTEVEKAILRNCYFAQADALFDLGKYPEAAAAYSSASNVDQSQPEVLEAFVQIAACHRRMNNFGKARGTLEQAKVVLDRIDKNAQFNKTTTQDSLAQWRDFLDWLSQL